jgi:hypothetical protein
MKYRISFRHNRTGKRKGTLAAVAFGDGEYSGFSRCHPNDKWNPETGRKMALKDAMVPLARSIRTALWKAYFNRKLKGQIDL